jgi:coatomer subunit beta'
LVQQVFDDDGVEDSQEDAVEVDADGSTDGTIHVNGNDSEEQWGTNKEESSA